MAPDASNGATKVSVLTKGRVTLPTIAGSPAVGTQVYALDSNSFTTVATSAASIGKILSLDDDGAYVVAFEAGALVSA